MSVIYLSYHGVQRREKWRVAEVTSPSVPPKPQETLAVQLRSANSKVSKATNERKAAAKRAAQQVGSVDPLPLIYSANGKKNARYILEVGEVCFFVFLYVDYWLVTWKIATWLQIFFSFSLNTFIWTHKGGGFHTQPCIDSFGESCDI